MEWKESVIAEAARRRSPRAPRRRRFGVETCSVSLTCTVWRRASPTGLTADLGHPGRFVSYLCTAAAMELYPVSENLLLRRLAHGKGRLAAGSPRHLTLCAGQHVGRGGGCPPGGSRSVEVAVGREGFAGVALYPGAERALTSAAAGVQSRARARKGLRRPAA